MNVSLGSKRAKMSSHFFKPVRFLSSGKSKSGAALFGILGALVDLDQSSRHAEMEVADADAAASEQANRVKELEQVILQQLTF